MTTLPGRAVLVRRDRVVANDLNETDTVMLDVEQGTYFGVTGVGRVIWDRLATRTTLDALVGELTETYDVDEPTCRSEVSAFVTDLVDQGLVDVEDSSAAP